jgi:Lipocalin-like domain
MFRVLGIMFGAMLATAFAAGSAAAQSAPSGESTKRIVGLWRLVGMTAGGAVNPERGAHATGMLLYDATGYMAVQIMPDRPRRKWSGPQPTPDEALDTVIGYSAYFGTYRVDEQARTVTHIRAGGIEPGPLADQVRRFELVGDNKLILRPVRTNSETTWERIR